jgi:hypothetical protein
MAALGDAHGIGLLTGLALAGLLAPRETVRSSAWEGV